MSNALSNLKKYFDLYDGNQRDLEECMPVIEETFDESLIIVKADGSEHTYSQWLKDIEGIFVAGGFTVEMVSMTEVPGGILYHPKIHFPTGKVVELRSLGIVKDGKIVRVEPQENAEAYNELLKSQ